MPSDGSPPSPRLSFTRRTLRCTSRWLEDGHEGMNPHKFYRALRSRLDRIHREQETDVQIVGERRRELQVGTGGAGLNTGVFRGRVQARASRPALGPARFEHRPWGPHGAFLIALGVGMALFGALHLLPLIVGLAMVAAGAWAFSRTETGEIPLRRRDVISVLMQGESRENQRWTPVGQRAELTSEMDVVYGGEVFLTVDEHGIDELPWALRSELANRCERWGTTLASDPRGVPSSQEGVAMGFLDGLKAWARLEGNWTRQQVEDWQRGLRASLPRRQAYAQLLSRRRETDVRETELDRVEDTMETVASEMRAYVARERLPPLADAASETAPPSLEGVAPSLRMAPNAPRRHDGPRPRARTSAARETKTPVQPPDRDGGPKRS